ncbi:hypothetical protein EAG_04326 [Camponotus floridanus]|uniref:Uncharacterized protein n=1 Tax=Camponotus floridanus TaxID=104421 RepID=E2AHQ3_CAMFO|nr:hypothetical protein EAG_04326 [Camponotus floridanus]
MVEDALTTGDNFDLSHLMIIQTKDLAKDTDGDMSTYERSSDTHHLTTMTRIVGVCTAVGILSRRPRRDRNDPSVFTSNEEGMKREKHSAFHYRMKGNENSLPLSICKTLYICLILMDHYNATEGSSLIL